MSSPQPGDLTIYQGDNQSPNWPRHKHYYIIKARSDDGHYGQGGGAVKEEGSKIRSEYPWWAKGFTTIASLQP